MSSTYTQIYIQVVMVVKNRKALISPAWEEELYKYITGIVQKKGQKMLAINGMPEHLHFFIGMKSECQLSGLVREIKKSSNNFINENRLTSGKFYWQAGFGAFSYSHSHLHRVITYIQNQKEHHKKKTLKDEYIQFLRKYEIEFKNEYLFNWID